jgi:hypothetical protein
MAALKPTQLQKKLIACAGPKERAAEVLSFLVSSAGARAGYVLLSRNGELVLAASSDQRELPAQLMERARALWASDQASHSEADNTRTLDARQLGSTQLESQDWQAPDGERYLPRVLGIYRNSRWVPVGIAVLAADENGPRRIRHAYVDAICNALLESGDVVDSAG